MLKKNNTSYVYLFPWAGPCYVKEMCIYKMQVSLSRTLHLLSQCPIPLGRQEKLLPLIFHKS